MNPQPPPIKVEKQIVLLGAGNAHLVFIKRWRMKSVPGYSVLLINESPTMPYSAMVPGFIANEYRRDEVEVDLVTLCQSAGVRLLSGRVTSLDATRRTLRIEGRPYELGYDGLSLNVGAEAPAPEPSQFALRPIARFLSRLSELDERMTKGEQPKNLIVAGAGPSGCELAVAFSQRYAAQRPSIHVFEKHAKLLPQFSAGAAKWFLGRFTEQGIYFHAGTQWDDSAIEADAAIFATSSQPLGWLKDSGLALTNGFVSVNGALQSTSHPDVFAVGDCAHFGPRPALPKNGVYSVRMGDTLYHNVLALFQNGTLAEYHPQSNYLALFNGGHGQGLLTRNGFSLSGAWTRRLKDRIDRKWMHSFQTEALPADTSRCAGCAAKVPAAVLQPSLEKAGVVAGSDLAEDCAVLPGNGDDVTLSTIDFVPSFLDDPYLVGKITALHCLSDIFAMNGTPETVLVTLMLPWASGRLQKEWFEEAMAGIREAAAEHGAKVVGGHTGEGDKFCTGLAVTGKGRRSTLFLKKNLQVGDRLVLTKPLGTGTILAAHMRRMVTASELGGAVSQMLVSNAAAARAMASSGINAVTDVTGFGLVGHLVEMLRTSGKSAVLTPEKLPQLAGARRLSDLGVRSTLYPENVAAFPNVATRLTGFPLLFDPQTSGGLLAGVPENRWNAFTDAAQKAGVPYWEIGHVTGEPDSHITSG